MKGLIFTYVLCYGGAVVALFRPFYGLLIFMCFGMIKPEATWPWSVTYGNYSRIIGIALLIGWLFNGLGNLDVRKAKTIVLFLSGYMVWAFICAQMAPNDQVAMGFVMAQFKIVLPFIVGVTLIDSIGKLKAVIWMLVLVHAFLAWNVNVDYFSGGRQMQTLGIPGIGDNNTASIVMVTAAGMAFALAIHQSGPILSFKRLLSTSIALVAAALMAHSVLFSESRGGMLALVIVGVFMSAMVLFEPKKWGWFLAAGCIALATTGPNVIADFMTVFVDKEERDASASSRVELWGNCWTEMVAKPIFGAGPDHWGQAVVKYGWPEGKEAHSVWMQTGAELGFPGFFCLTGFYAVGMWQLWQIIRNRDQVDPDLVLAARVVIPSLVGFIIAASFVTVDMNELPYYVMLVGAGTIKLAGPLTQGDRNQQLQAPQPAAQTLTNATFANLSPSPTSQGGSNRSA